MRKKEKAENKCTHRDRFLQSLVPNGIISIQTALFVLSCTIGANPFVKLKSKSSLKNDNLMLSAHKNHGHHDHESKEEGENI